MIKWLKRKRKSMCLVRSEGLIDIVFGAFLIFLLVSAKIFISNNGFVKYPIGDIFKAGLSIFAVLVAMIGLGTLIVSRETHQEDMDHRKMDNTLRYVRMYRTEIMQSYSQFSQKLASCTKETLEVVHRLQGLHEDFEDFDVAELVAILEKASIKKSGRELNIIYKELVDPARGYSAFELLNRLEEFSMAATNSTTYEEKMYPILHQTFIDSLSILYFIIAFKNQGSYCNHFYCNTIELYSRWVARLKMDKCREREMFKSLKKKK